MFENIIGYNGITDHFSQLVLEGKVPPVMIISGAMCTGKQTISTELSRVLLCNEGGDWDCTCGNCVNCKTMSHQDVIFAGASYAISEIHYAHHLLRKFKSRREVYFFVRALSKVLRRADSVLWEGSDTWTKSLKSPSDQFRESFIQYQEREDNYFDTSKISSLVGCAIKLHKAFPARMLPVQCIRNIISWAHIRTSSAAKIIIINEVESMLPSSANMLLKTLEEPPENVYFILLSNNINAILPTIKSRARSISLPQRTRKDIEKVLTQVFKIHLDEDKTKCYGSIKEFLDGYSYEAMLLHSVETEEHNAIQNYAKKYFNSLKVAVPFHSELIHTNSTKHAKLSRDFALIFLYYLTIYIRELLFDANISSIRVRTLWSLCEAARKDIQIRNLSPSFVLEVYYYRFLEEYEKIN